MGLMFSCCYYNAIKPVDNNGMIANGTGGRNIAPPVLQVRNYTNKYG